MTTTRARRLTAAEVVATSGLTYRQLDYWCRAGVLGPERARGPGTGYPREWTPEDVAILCALRRLRGLGTRCPDLARAERLLRSSSVAGPGWLVLLDGKLSRFVPDAALAVEDLLAGKVAAVVRFDPEEGQP